MTRHVTARAPAPDQSDCFSVLSWSPCSTELHPVLAWAAPQLVCHAQTRCVTFLLIQAILFSWVWKTQCISFLPCGRRFWLPSRSWKSDLFGGNRNGNYLALQMSKAEGSHVPDWVSDLILNLVTGCHILTVLFFIHSTLCKFSFSNYQELMGF